MHCVICGRPVVDVQYANAWEASLKQHPCCSRECAAKFDPDVHWFPAEPPTPLDDAAASRLMERGETRLKQGDAPHIVARDQLLAGMPPWMVRRTLLGAAASAVASDKKTSGWNIFGARTLAVLGVGVFVGDRNRGLADAGQVLDGSSQVDAWEDHFGIARSES